MGRGDDERYNDAADEACIQSERRKFENAIAKREALEENFKKTFGNAMKQNAVKKALALEAREATRSADRRWRGRSVDEIMEQGGFNHPNESRTVTEEEAYSRPWEE